MVWSRVSFTRRAQSAVQNSIRAVKTGVQRVRHAEITEPMKLRNWKPAWNPPGELRRTLFPEKVKFRRRPSRQKFRLRTMTVQKRFTVQNYTFSGDAAATRYCFSREISSFATAVLLTPSGVNDAIQRQGFSPLF